MIATMLAEWLSYVLFVLTENLHWLPIIAFALFCVGAIIVTGEVR